VYRSTAERLAKINWESIGGRIEKEQEEGLQVSEGESGVLSSANECTEHEEQYA
jgi:hypothetical protein